MRQVIALLFIMFAITSCGSFNSTNDDVETAAKASVKITDRTGHGSGFIYKNGIVMTNKHVVEETIGDIVVTLSNGHKHVATVKWIGKGTGQEIALLSVDTENLKTAPVSCEVVKQGDRVFTYGNPKLLDNIATFGRVAGFDHSPRMQLLINDAVILDMVAQPGNSGGAVWSYGKVIGLTTAVIPPGLTVMFPMTKICELLK